MFEEFAKRTFNATREFASSLPNERTNADLFDTLLIESFTNGNSAAEGALSLIVISGDGTSSGSSVSFSSNFDFHSFGTLLLQKAAEFEEYESFTTYPTNFFSEWAARDIEATIQFYSEHLASGKNEIPLYDFEELADGYLNTLTSQQQVHWIGKMLSDESLNRYQKGDVMDAALDRFSCVEELIELQEDKDCKDSLTGEFLKNISHSGGEQAAQKRRKLLLHFFSPSSRINFIVENAKSLSGHFTTNNLSQDLRLLGHSQEDITRFREAAKQALK
jgi:hypothetical protein